MRLARLLVLIAVAACGKKTVVAAPPDPVASVAPPLVAPRSDDAAVLFEDGHVVLKERSGDVRWRVPVAGHLGSVRPPDRLLHGNRVFVVADSKLVALDAKDGRRVWDAPGPADRIYGHGAYVLTTDCTSPSAMDRPRWVVARLVDDGKEAFKVEIPKSVDPNPMTQVSDTIFVGDARSTTAIDTDARKKRFSIEEGLVVAYAIGSDWLLATTKRIVRLGKDGERRWERPVLRDTFVGRGGVVPVDGEDVVVYGYSAIADSGVELVRLRLADGTERWRSFAKPAGVDHSEYEHNAEVVLKNGVLHVASRGSYASFDETFSADKGVSLSRSLDKR